MRIIVFHNIATDEARRSAAWQGYRPGHPLVPVHVFESAESDGRDPSMVAEMVYHLLNVGDDPEFGTPRPEALRYRANQNRSLSVGDVLLIGEQWWACASAGFTMVPAPRWLAHGASKHGTTPVPAERWSPALPLDHEEFHLPPQATGTEEPMCACGESDVYDGYAECPVHPAEEPAVNEKVRLTGDQLGEALSGSEHYAAGRMTHRVIINQTFTGVQSEVVHDALMASFQAGYLAAAEGTSVDELLARMAAIDPQPKSGGRND